MFEQIKAAIKRDMTYAAEAKYHDPVRDTLITNYLLVEMCERVGSMQSTKQNDVLVLPNTYRKIQEDQHDSIMIAFMLDHDTARQLALPGGEPAEELHCTLCFMGDVEDFVGDVEDLKATVAQFAADQVPIGGTIGGIGRFSPSEHSDNLSPVIALVNVPGLQEFRRKLASILDSTGMYVAENFDYLPHCTLCYVDPNAGMPIQNIEPLPLTFGTLWLCIGDKRIDYKLGSIPPPTEVDNKDSSPPPPTQEEAPQEAASEDTYNAIQDHPSWKILKDVKYPLTRITPGKYLHAMHETEDPDASGNDRQKLEAAIAAIFLAMQVASHGDLFGRMTAIAAYALPDTGKRRLANGLAVTYMTAQQKAYDSVRQTVGVDLPGLVIAGSDALARANEQVRSIDATMRDQFANMVKNLPPDIASDELATQANGWVQNYASYKAPQIANVTLGSGADVGMNAALTDILDMATDPTQTDVINTDNIRVRVVPAESSSDACKKYAGNEYSIADYFSLQITWPFHPNCPHHIEAFIADESGNEIDIAGDEN